MDSILAQIAERNAQIEIALDARLAASDADVAAIEVVPDDAGQRDLDRRLVREALDARVPIRDLGSLLVTVVTDFAYEIDWKDQFSFWPNLNNHLRSQALDLQDVEARRSVERAFRELADRHRGVRPVGEMAQHFPLMSWPLVHAIMPWCAQRHIARVLERAVALGLVPDDPGAPWPEGEVEALAASMRLPVFALGILQNPTVLARLGRTLLGGAQRADAPAWEKRLHRGVARDSVARALVAAAQESQRERVNERRSRPGQLPMCLVLQTENGQTGAYRLWASLGPYSRSVASSPDVLTFARAGAQIFLRTDETDRVEVPLFNALVTPALAPVTWKSQTLSLRPSVRPPESGEVPEILRRIDADSKQTFTLPLLFRREDEQRYQTTTAPVLTGDSVLLLAPRSSGLANDLAARGFTVEAVHDSPNLAALVGVVSEAAATVLRGVNIDIKAPSPALAPVLFPAIRREEKRLVYRAGTDVWLKLRDAPNVPLRAEILRSGETTTVVLGQSDEHQVLIRVPADMLGVGVYELKIYPEGKSRAIANLEIAVEPLAQEAGLARWSAVLHPADATIEHLREDQCWLEVDSIPGVDIEVEMRAGERRAARLLRPYDRSLLNTARCLRDLSTDILPQGDNSLERVEVRARASDESDGWVTVAELGASEASLRFDLSGASPVICAPDEAPELTRAEITINGLQSEPTSGDSIREPGLYVARVGSSRAALLVCEQQRQIPRVPKPDRFIRSIARSMELFSTLRAVDVASVWPESARGGGVLLRRSIARGIERELIGALCGRAWAEMEDDVDRSSFEALVPAMAKLLWMNADALQELFEGSEEPLTLLHDLLEIAEEPPESKEAKHLTLLFHRRGMTTEGRDEAAVRWAWASVRRARIARACALLAAHTPAPSEEVDDDDAA